MEKEIEKKEGERQEDSRGQMHSLEK
uniref:Uncharacterized protein n=1 Tax=Anguilla anguilla TaxID=7936 RepID=A0A0E9T761_ANGAN